MTRWWHFSVDMEKGGEGNVNLGSGGLRMESGESGVWRVVCVLCVERNEVGGNGCWWMVVVHGWWWVVVGGDGWWWMVIGGGGGC